MKSSKGNKGNFPSFDYQYIHSLTNNILYGISNGGKSWNNPKILRLRGDKNTSFQNKKFHTSYIIF